MGLVRNFHFGLDPVLLDFQPDLGSSTKLCLTWTKNGISRSDPPVLESEHWSSPVEAIGSSLPKSMRTLPFAPFSDQFMDNLRVFRNEKVQSISTFRPPNHARTAAKPPKLSALFPKCMHCRLNWPEKGVQNSGAMDRLGGRDVSTAPLTHIPPSVCSP